MVAAFLTTVLFSISAVCGNRAGKLLGGTDANFWRLVFAAALLAVYAHPFGGGAGGAAFPLFLISGCIGFGVGDIALFQTLPRLGSRLSVMLVLCLSSPLAAVLEWLWMGTNLTTAQIFAGLMTLAGVAIALAPGKDFKMTSRVFVPGVLFGLTAAFCQGYGAVLSRKAFALAAAAGEDVDGVTAAYQRILGGVAVTAICLLVLQAKSAAQLWAGRRSKSRGERERKAQWRRAWPWVILNGLSGPALGVSCFQWALKNSPTGVVLPIVAVTPLVIIPFSRYIEGERLNRRSLAGGLIAVLGAAALAWVSTRSK